MIKQRTVTGRRWAGAIVGAVILALAAAGPVTAAEPREVGRVFMHLSRTAGPENVTYGFFDEVTGERVARLKIARLTLDYGRQGVFRVAWKPKAALQGFELTIFDAAAWPAVSGQLADLLAGMGGRGGLTVREVVIVRSDDETARVSAATADFSPAGELILRDVSRDGVRQPDFTLPLRGARAGLPDFLLFSVRSAGPVSAPTGESLLQP